MEILQETFNWMSFERMGQAGMLEQPSGVLSRPVLMFPPHCNPALVAVVQPASSPPPKEEPRLTAQTHSRACHTTVG